MTKHVHLIGIGGIGLSALAQYYHAMGWQVSGSDATRSEITDFLAARDIEVVIGHAARNIDGADLVVHSAAVKAGNEEYDAARSAGVATQLYAEAVGELTRQYRTVAISGSHGKSTTTAMVAKVLIDAGLDPTVIVGTKMFELGNNNFRLGQSKLLVLEADDYNRHFHNYQSSIAVVTNVDAEHLDIYQDLDGVKQAFGEFMEMVVANGTLIVNGENAAAREVATALDIKTRQLVFYGPPAQPFELKLPGAHNQSNAEAAWQVAKVLGVSEQQTRQSLAEFAGTWRRLEELRPGVFTDYAHHPTEIKATLEALKQDNPGKQLICVFQPHQRDRLTKLFDEFARSFAAADEVVLIPLYQVRGRDDQPGKTSQELVAVIQHDHVTHVGSFRQAFDMVQSKFDDQHIVVFMGAGDIDEQLRSRVQL